MHIIMQQAYDYIAEVSDLADVLSNRPAQIFNLETLFKSWTINDGSLASSS